MQIARSARVLALVATVLLLALLAAGCGRRTLGANDGFSPAPATTAAADPTGGATVPPAAQPATSPAATPMPAATPAPTPDLSAIDSLIRDIDNDLQADASAGANEGTAP